MDPFLVLYFHWLNFICSVLQHLLSFHKSEWQWRKSNMIRASNGLIWTFTFVLIIISLSPSIMEPRKVSKGLFHFQKRSFQAVQMYSARCTLQFDLEMWLRATCGFQKTWTLPRPRLMYVAHNHHLVGDVHRWKNISKLDLIFALKASRQ